MNKIKITLWHVFVNGVRFHTTTERELTCTLLARLFGDDEPRIAEAVVALKKQEIEVEVPTP